MVKPKPHFEQVPVEIVKKIIVEQSGQPGATDSPDLDKGGVCQKESPKRAN
jgi:hypothetical protein